MQKPIGKYSQNVCIIRLQNPISDICDKVLLYVFKTFNDRSFAKITHGTPNDTILRLAANINHKTAFVSNANLIGWNPKPFYSFAKGYHISETLI